MTSFGNNNGPVENDTTYEFPTAEMSEDFGTINRPDNTVVTCDVKSNMFDAMDDTIHAAWNGWEAACKFKDEAYQDYYMKIINEVSTFRTKFRKIKKQ